MTDCLIIGFNDSNFEEYVDMVRSMGTDSGAYRDLNLSFVEYDDKPYRSMDLLNRFYFEDKPGAHRPFHNADFLWPVVLYLGSYLHRRGFSFDYVNLFHLEKDKLREKLARDDILTIAITTTLYVTAHPILEIMSFIREHNQTAKIVVGGPYIHNQTRMADPLNLQRLLKYIGADVYVISQEGEAALAQLLAALKHGASLDSVDNIAYRQGDRYVLTNCSVESNSLPENLFDYSLFPREEINGFISLRTAKSCPFSCAFCGFPQRAGTYTYISVDLVEKELNTLNDLGVTTVTFLDDTFNVPKKRFQEILRMMIRNRYDFKWNSFYRSDHGDDETIELMGRAGCEGVFLGMESGSDEMLKRMNKSVRRKNFLHAIPLLRAAGVSTHANLIIGFPGETYETVQETIDLIEEVKPDFFRAQLWYADPVTPVWKRREEYGIKGEAFSWSHDTMDYQTACDLIEKMFLTVENSVWLQQHGFEQWSTFYLQRKGMSLERIKSFLTCFNTIVKQKLIDPQKQEIDPLLLESLRRSCRFDDPAPLELGAVEVWSGAGYKAAERYWTQEFHDRLPASNLATAHDEREPADDGRASHPCPVARDVLDRIAASCGAEPAHVVLAAYGVLLSRLDGREERAMVVALPGAAGEVAVPVRLAARWELNFSAFLKQLQRQIDQALAHRLYAFSILTNPWRMAEHGAACPAFEVAYQYREAAGVEAGLEDALRLYPAVSRAISLVLSMTDTSAGIDLRFSYKKSWFSPQTVEEFGAYLATILEEVDKNPDVQLGEIVLDSAAKVVNAAVEIDASEEFNF